MKQILLLGHTHHDVGYTNSPRIIDRMHARIVDEVLDLIDANPGTGPDPATNPDAQPPKPKRKSPTPRAGRKRFAGGGIMGLKLAPLRNWHP